MKITAKRNVGFLLLKEVYNLPGRAYKIMDVVRDLGIYIDGLWAIARPGEKISEVIMLGMEGDLVDKVFNKIRTIDAEYKDISEAFIEIIKNLTCVTLSDIDPEKAPSILYKCFNRAKEFNINIEMIHTTRKELTFYVKREAPIDGLIRRLKMDLGMI